MERMGLSTRWNFQTSLYLLGIVQTLIVTFSEGFGLSMSSLWKRIVVFPLDRCYTFSNNNFFNMTANVAFSKSSVLFDYVDLPRYQWNRDQCFAGLFLIYWTCRHRIGSFRIYFGVIMELKWFSTRWNFSDAHITARYCTDPSFNTLRRIWFV